MKNLHKYLLASFFSLQILTSSQAQKIEMDTEYGKIDMELYPEKAPITVANFLRYIDQKSLDGSTFFRVVRMDNQPNSKVKIEVIQGGSIEDSTRHFPAISHETTEKTGLKHLDGTLSMARVGPGTATSEFFICINDQPALDFGGLRNPDSQGFAAFGKVIMGMDIVRKIQSQKTGEKDRIQYLEKPVKILKVTRVE